MSDWIGCSRREFLKAASALSIAVSSTPLRLWSAEDTSKPEELVAFPGRWAFQRPRSSIILVSDQQLRDLQEPDKPVDLSLTKEPQVTTLRKLCREAQNQGAKTVILAFDEFWTQYRAGQGGRPRELLPDSEEYIRCLTRISKTLEEYGLGFELSLLSPLEVGKGYERKTGERGQWVQYREGYRDPRTGEYTVSLWEQRRWTNNKGAIEVKRTGVKVLAFREQRLGNTSYYHVDPSWVRELPTPPETRVDESSESSTHSRRLTISGRGDTSIGGLNRVLVLVTYATPEMDYFSAKALPFLQGLVEQYHQAGIPLNGLYADEMHIQQDWNYFGHHDEGQFAFRYLTPSMASRFAELYGEQHRDFARFLVYFCYGQHGFLPSLEARLPAQHVLGTSAEDIHKTFLLRRRYYDLLENSVVELFANAKKLAESKYGRELEARAHATWAQSPTIDLWRSADQPLPPRQYEYTPDFIWSNTVQQAASACSDYFAWNEFLTGGGNDHAEGGWLDRNYYGIALACSTGVLNRTPYAYAAAWGMPGAVWQRHQAVCDAFGASANPWFQAVQDCQHREIEVLMVYPHSLVACEERFGSWIVQYGYANYVSPRKLVELGKVNEEGKLEIAGRKYGTVAVLFEPLPPVGMLELLHQFAEAGGKVVWGGPPPRVQFDGALVLDKWCRLFGLDPAACAREGRGCAGWQIHFSGVLEEAPPQSILTDFLVDYVYTVAKPNPDVAVVARLGSQPVATHRMVNGRGTALYLGFRPRDDQSSSLGSEVSTWFHILRAIGAYPGSRPSLRDNPAEVSRTTPWVACRFPNGATALAVHYREIVESWPGGFHRDAKHDEEIMRGVSIPSDKLLVQGLRINGHLLEYEGREAVAFRVNGSSALIGFAGYDCSSITVDGEEFRFAEKPMALVAWAPVLPERRTGKGATLEVWVHGEGELRIPVPENAGGGRLYSEGRVLGSRGEEVPCEVRSGLLRFRAVRSWGRRHLYFVPTA